jgi:hypothetical protein
LASGRPLIRATVTLELRDRRRSSDFIGAGTLASSGTLAMGASVPS